jgi:hypothetical protein
MTRPRRSKKNVLRPPRDVRNRDQIPVETETLTSRDDRDETRPRRSEKKRLETVPTPRRSRPRLRTSLVISDHTEVLVFCLRLLNTLSQFHKDMIMTVIFLNLNSIVGCIL